MDLVYSKYSNPWEFMRLYIEQGRFGEFVNEIITAEQKRRKKEAEDEEEKILWEFWLHKVIDMTYAEFRSSINSPTKTANGLAQPKADLKQTVKDSVDILTAFAP